MKKYYVTSDIHSFYDEFITALNRSGFDIDNPDHILIICGDIFDRGSKPLQIYNFLKSLPKERRILVRGNHELLLEELVQRGYPEYHDEHNGTIDTLYQLKGYKNYQEFMSKKFFNIVKQETKYGTFEYESIMEKWKNKEKKVFNNRLIKQILKWINSDEWVNYYELNNYIFVHSFIPLKSELVDDTLVKSYDPNWRQANSADWQKAMWGCPWKNVKAGYFDEEIKNGKTLVCGHWHASDFYNNLEYKKEPEKWLNVYTDNPIYLSKNLIALDACTVATKGINILVINEDNSIEIYDHNKEKIND